MTQNVTPELIADLRAKLAAATEAKGAKATIRTYLSLAAAVLGPLPALLDEIERLRSRTGRRPGSPEGGAS